MHPRRHIDCVQLSFHIPTLPPPFLLAGTSALVDFVVRCIFLCLVFCPRRLVFFLSTFHFSTEDGFPHVLEPSWRAIPFPWSRSTPHYPVSMRAHHPFAFFSSLFAQTLPQENCRPLLLTPEPSRASTCTGEEGRRRYVLNIMPKPPTLLVAALPKAGIVELVAAFTLEIDIPSLQGTPGARWSAPPPPPRHPRCDQAPLLPRESAVSRHPRLPTALIPTVS